MSKNADGTADAGSAAWTDHEALEAMRGLAEEGLEVEATLKFVADGSSYDKGMWDFDIRARTGEDPEALLDSGVLIVKEWVAHSVCSTPEEAVSSAKRAFQDRRKEAGLRPRRRDPGGEGRVGGDAR